MMIRCRMNLDNLIILDVLYVLLSNGNIVVYACRMCEGLVVHEGET